MLVSFESHSILDNQGQIEITLVLNDIDFEFSKEISKKHTPESRDMNESILEYISRNMPEIKNAVVKVVSGSLLVCTVSLSSIQSVVGESTIPKAVVNEAATHSPEIDIWIDDTKLHFNQRPLLIEDSIYLPLRELCNALGVAINYNEAQELITLEGNGVKISFGPEKKTALKNDKEIQMPQTILLNNVTLAPLRFLSEELGYFVQWDQETKTVYITQESLVTEKDSITQYGKEKIVQEAEALGGYEEEDLYWLSRLVHAESQSEGYEGKLAVANVILNRVKDENFPKTVKEVIFDRRYGVQFVPTVNGMLYNSPNEESMRAAKAALSGQDNSNGALYFLNPKKAKNNWIPKNREHAFTIDNHQFYF